MCNNLLVHCITISKGTQVILLGYDGGDGSVSQTYKMYWIVKKFQTYLYEVEKYKDCRWTIAGRVHSGCQRKEAMGPCICLAVTIIAFWKIGEQKSIFQTWLKGKRCTNLFAVAAGGSGNGKRVVRKIKNIEQIPFTWINIHGNSSRGTSAHISSILGIIDQLRKVAEAITRENALEERHWHPNEHP